MSTKTTKKKEVSLVEMAEKLKAYALKNKKKYYTIQVSYSHHLHIDNSGIPSIEISAYIDGYGYVKGDTIEECIKQFNKNKIPSGQKLADVKI